MITRVIRTAVRTTRMGCTSIKSWPKGQEFRSSALGDLKVPQSPADRRFFDLEGGGGIKAISVDRRFFDLERWIGAFLISRGIEV